MAMKIPIATANVKGSEQIYFKKQKMKIIQKENTISITNT